MDDDILSAEYKLAPRVFTNTFLVLCSASVAYRVARLMNSQITLGNKISLFFLAHEGKYQILIELLTLNSNM